MDDTWQLQQAKAELSRLIDGCQRRGPQTITRHGRAVAVVVAADDFKRLKRRRPDFKTFLLKAPVGELDLQRSRDTGRAVVL